MRHQRYNRSFQFVKEPMDFNKYTPRDVLQYCLGATMYMPGNKDFIQAIIDKKYSCFVKRFPQRGHSSSIHITP